MFKISKEDFQKLSNFIYKKSGIILEYNKHFEKIQKYFFNKKKNFKKYFFYLKFEDKQEIEFQNLINSITVNETYFFRESYQFNILVKYLLKELDKIKPDNDSIRILSAPCSTGEEAYSIAIYILEDNSIINKRDIEIVGIDINSTVIEKARLGYYNERSLHNLSDKLKKKYFQKIGLKNKLNRELTDVIAFKKVNIFNKLEMQVIGKFDIIFSRNMLIYFDDKSKKEVAMNFYNSLNQNGYILLGHAEYMNEIISIFKTKKYDGYLVYQK